MFKNKLSINIGKKFLRSAQSTNFNAYLFTYNNRQNNHQNRQDNSRYTYAQSAIAFSLGILAYQQAKKNAEAEGKSTNQNNSEDEDDTQSDEPFYQKSLRKNMEIPFLLQMREKQKKEEYKQREEVDIQEIDRGISKDEVKQLNDLDKLYGEWNKEEDGNRSDNDYVQDPYAQRREAMMRHQEYRIIKVGSPDLLKNGQMIQVAICDPFDPQKFHQTDKVIIAKHNEKYYAVGSFCGFDYTNLATGAFLGEKLICPTCGSTYNITSGFVDQGPSLRNISSFLIQSRDDKIQLVLPEHVPAFAKKKFIERTTIDPRTFVVLGDSETALSAIDALRASFSGKIVVVPSSPYGQFENTDILNKKFTPINKNESYLVEEDYMDRANIDVVKGEIKSIDLNKKEITVKGVKKAIPFDKVLIAWGSHKKRLSKEYSNVFILEDRHSHARCHNEILKAKSILVMGGSFEAYQTAASIREYLDSIGYEETQIIIMNQNASEIQQTFGKEVAEQIHTMMRQLRISVIMQADITKIQGLNKIEGIYFLKPNPIPSEKNVEFYISPDIIIAEDGIGTPKYNLSQILTPATNSEIGEPPLKIGIDPHGVPSSDMKFSLHYNDLFSPILAAGSCTSFPSFIHKIKVRTPDIKYNIEAGFFAAMSMLDKRVEFRYLPFTSLKVGENPIYFIGERNHPYSEVIINGNVEENKFVAFYVYGNEITGIMTCGYQNLHLYLWEAMKLLIMPPATQLRNHSMDYKSIVKKVLQIRPNIQCKRHDIVTVPSITLAEFDNELDKSLEFRSKMRVNVENENQIQKEKFKKMKEKYDRDGVEFIQDELELKEKREAGDETPMKDKALTGAGGRKPGQTSTRETYMKKSSEEDQQQEGGFKNPLNMIINAAKKNFSG